MRIIVFVKGCLDRISGQVFVFSVYAERRAVVINKRYYIGFIYAVTDDPAYRTFVYFSINIVHARQQHTVFCKQIGFPVNPRNAGRGASVSLEIISLPGNCLPYVLFNNAVAVHTVLFPTAFNDSRGKFPVCAKKVCFSVNGSNPRFPRAIRSKIIGVLPLFEPTGLHRPVAVHEISFPVNARPTRFHDAVRSEIILFAVQCRPTGLHCPVR